VAVPSNFTDIGTFPLAGFPDAAAVSRGQVTATVTLL